MSFRIDDILKQNCSKEGVESPNIRSLEDNTKLQLNSVNLVKGSSILEYTLTNRDYYKNSVQHEVFNNKISLNYGSERIYTDLYMSKGPNVRYPYTRNPSWVSHSPYPVILNYPHLHTRRKGGQIRFTTSQTEELEKQFNSHKYLSPEDRRQLADFLRLSDRQVKTWFQNRRAKWRRNNQLCSSRNKDLVMNNIRKRGLPDISNSRINYQY